MSADVRGFRKNVGAVLVRDGLVLMGERIDRQDIWQFPQGGVEPGESPEDAIWREITEELGILAPRLSCRILGIGPETRYYFPEGYSAEIARRYRGQDQTLFVFDYDGDDASIDPLRHSEPEFSRVRWFDVDEARERLWAFKSEPFEATIAALPTIFKR